MWFNEYKRIITNDGEKKLTPVMGLFGGMSAGCFSTLGNNPFDVVKVRMRVVSKGSCGSRSRGQSWRSVISSCVEFQLISCSRFFWIRRCYCIHALHASL